LAAGASGGRICFAEGAKSVARERELGRVGAVTDVRMHEKAPVLRTGAKVAGWTGLEPATFCVTASRTYL